MSFSTIRVCVLIVAPPWHMAKRRNPNAEEEPGPGSESTMEGRASVEDLRMLKKQLSDVSAALRLRYEFRRELAPYIGIEWINQYGRTEELTRAVMGDPSDTRIVAGLRFWF